MASAVPFSATPPAPRKGLRGPGPSTAGTTSPLLPVLSLPPGQQGRASLPEATAPRPSVAVVELAVPRCWPRRPSRGITLHFPPAPCSGTRSRPGPAPPPPPAIGLSWPRPPPSAPLSACGHCQYLSRCCAPRSPASGSSRPRSRRTAAPGSPGGTGTTRRPLGCRLRCSGRSRCRAAGTRPGTLGTRAAQRAPGSRGGPRGAPAPSPAATPDPLCPFSRTHGLWPHRGHGTEEGTVRTSRCGHTPAGQWGGWGGV